MKKKVGTILDEELFFKAKQAAALKKESLSQFLENSLRMYLLTIEGSKGKKEKNICKSTQGAMKISRSALKNIMEEEGLYDS